MELRQRRGKRSLEKVVQEMDAFPKVPETYVEQTTSGAIISIVTFVLVCALVWSELDYFFDPGYTFKFVPDSDFSSKLSINIDITIAMPCDLIGADILDTTNQNTFKFGRLKEEPTWFELDRAQRRHFEEMRAINTYLREEYHAVQDIMWKTGMKRFYGDLPERRTFPKKQHDACRMHGTLHLNKVSGNFHITAGKSVPLLHGHAHLTGFMGPKDYNFTHRINKFSFGDSHMGMVHPLEAEEKITDVNMMNFQYYVEVVPTDVQSASGLTHSTYQYSVKELIRPIDHSGESHGVPGIYFKYDMSALKIIAQQDREPTVQFLVRLCAGVGGLVATSHMICGVIKALIGFYCCGISPNVPRQKRGADSDQTPLVTADLIAPSERITQTQQGFPKQ